MARPRKTFWPLFVSCSLIASASNRSFAAETITKVPSSGALSVSKNQVVAIDFGQLGSKGFALKGNLVNAGTIFAYSSDPSVNVAKFSALNITNYSRALITSVMPAGGFTGLNIDPIFLANTLSLSFAATRNFTNYGQISSAANLSVTAGNTITNTSSGVLSAAQNVNLSAITSIVNSGVISTQIGNLNAATALLNNRSGVLQSLNGSIDIHSISNNALLIQNTLGQINASQNVSIVNELLQSTGSKIRDGIKLSGGDITAKNISFLSPSNAVNVDAGTLNGSVSIDSASTSVKVKGGVLDIGSAVLTNDPVFLNGNGSLVLTIPGNDNDLGGSLNSYFFTSGQNFIALASGDVTITGSGTIDASNTLRQSVIRIGAGVTFDSNGNISGRSASGGNINMPQLTLRNFGGIVNLQAQNTNNVAGKGNITVGTVETTGFDGFPGGNGRAGGTVVMGATGAITVSSIVTSGGAGGAGSLGVLGADYTGTSAAAGTNRTSGTGGRGVDGLNGGRGTDAGSGGNGANAGPIFLTTAGLVNVGSIVANGGRGGQGGTGGDGGSGQAGGRGGNVATFGTGGRGGNGGYGGAGGHGGDGGHGGNSSQVSIIAGQLNLQSLSASGGLGGLGGSGGDGGDGADGGNRGSVGAVGRSGTGGDGNYGGRGGQAGTGGYGGNSGLVQLTTSSDISVSGRIDVSGGFGAAGGAGGSGGKGGRGLDGGGNLLAGGAGNAGNGGAGESGHGGGDGGDAGTLNITVSNGQFLDSSSIFANGGDGGIGGDGGAGNNAGAAGRNGTVAFVGRNGGSGGDGGGAGSGGGGGAGGEGGYIQINTSQLVSIAGNVHTIGGDGGNGGDGGAGGDGTNGGRGGSAAVGGSAGSGGNGGSANAGGGGGSGGDGGTIVIKSNNNNISISPTEGPISGVQSVNNGAFLDIQSGKNVFFLPGASVLQVSSTTGYFIGQRITLSSAERSEQLIVLGIGANTLSVTPLTHVYSTSFNDGFQTVSLPAPTIQSAPTGVIAAGGNGGNGGNGGAGGNGGNGATSGAGIFLQGSANGQNLPRGGFALNAGVSINIGFVGSPGGQGGVGGGGGIGGVGGNGGTISFLAPKGDINVNGNANASGGNGGNPGYAGLNGRDGSYGATRIYLGLTLGASLTDDGSFLASIIGPTLGLLGAVTIDNFTIGGLQTYDITNLALNLGPGQVLFLNHANLQGESTFNLQLGISESLSNPLYISVSSHGEFARHDIIDVAPGLATFVGIPGVNFDGVVTRTTQGTGNSVDLSLGLANISGGNSVIAPITGFGHGIVAPVSMGTAGASQRSIGGLNVGLTQTPTHTSGPASVGGQIEFRAGGNIDVRGTVSAAGGTQISIVKTRTFIPLFNLCTPCVTSDPVAEIGRGGVISLQASNITIQGVSAILPSGGGKAPVVTGGSITFLTRPSNVDFLVKPMLFGNLSWFTSFGLNIANGNGVVLETSPTTLIQNGSGDVSLTNYMSGGQKATGDLVVLASGNIIAPGVSGGSIVTAGSGSRPSGSIIMAAGTLAASRTYGTSPGQQQWLVLGGPSSTGGDIYLPNIKIGSANNHLVSLSAHSSSVANQQPFGSIYTGSVTSARGQASFGSIYINASEDIVSNKSGLTADFISMNSARGNIGSVKGAMSVNSEFLTFNSFAGTYIDSKSNNLNLLSSQAGIFIFDSTANLNVSGTIKAGAINIESNTLSIQNSVDAPGPKGIITVTTNAAINDAIGLSNLSSQRIMLESCNGSINVGNLSAPDTVILVAQGRGAGVTANSVTTTFLGALSSTGGIQVGSTSASEVLARSAGDVQITSTNAVNLGGAGGLPSRGRNFNLVAPGITVSGVLQADQGILLDASGGSSGVFLNRNVSASGVVDIRSGSNILSTNSMVNASTLNLLAVTDIGAPLKPLVNTASVLNLPSSGRDVFIYNDNVSSKLTLNNGFVGRNFVIMERGDLTLNGSVAVSERAGLAAIGGGSLLANGSITANSVLLQGSNTSPGIGRTSDGSVIQASGTVSASNLVLISGDGGIKSSSGKLVTSVSGPIEIHSSGAVGVNNLGVISNLNSRSKSLDLTTNSNITVQDVLTSKGNLSISTSSGALVIKDNVHVLAHDGNLILKNLSPVGTISIGKHDYLIATNPSGAIVEISVGPGAAALSNPTLPVANVVVDANGGGQVFLGANGLVASPPSNLIRAGGVNSKVIVDAPASNVSIGGESIVIANVVPQLTSLDLKDPQVAAEVKTLQNMGLLGGHIRLNAAGQAIGGNIVVLQTDIFPDLVGLSVPQDVVLTLRNFVSPVNVEVSPISFTNTVIVDGSLNFVGTANLVNSINIQTNTLPALSMGQNGVLSTRGTLSVAGNATLNLNGRVQAGSLNFQTTSGDIVSNALIRVPNGVVNLTTGNNGSVVVKNLVHTGFGTINLNANGSGTISGTGLLVANTLNLNSASGDIGTSADPLRTTTNTTVTSNTTGSVFVSRVFLGSSNSGSSTSLLESGVSQSANANATLAALLLDPGAIRSAPPMSNGVITVDGNLSLSGPIMNILSGDSAENVENGENANIAQQPFIFVGTIAGLSNNADNANQQSLLRTSNDGAYFLEAGCALFSPDRNIDVKTPFGSLSLSKDSIVLVVASDKAVSVYDLHDEHASDVSFKFEGRTLNLAPGSHVTITSDSTDSLGNANSLHMIGHRRVQSKVFGKNKEFSSEFSISSAMTEIKSIASLRNSKNSRERNAYKRMMKTAVVSAIMGASKGAYERAGSKP